MKTMTLTPGEWTRVPDTACILRYDGDHEVIVSQLAGGYWDLSPLASPGRVLVWVALVDRPELPPWPVLPSLNGRGAYFAGGASHG